MSRFIKEITRGNRKQQTEAEAVVWCLLRGRQFFGKKFLRQYPLTFMWNGKKRFFVADFYCHEHKLIIEVDGKIHEIQKDRDEMRDFIISTMGLKVLRIQNEVNLLDHKIFLEQLKATISPSLFKRGGRPADRQAGGEL